MMRRGTARRWGLLTRLKRGALWWRHSYHFRLAHRPLCEHFSNGVWRMGHVHLCRSCTLVYVGLGCAALVMLMMPLPTVWHGLATALLLPLVVVSSYPPRYQHFGRRVKDVLRLAAGVLIGLMIGHLCRGQWLWGTASLMIFGVAYHLSLRHYAEQKARACNGCPELGAGVCSGFQVQAASARLYALTVEKHMDCDAAK